MAKHLSAGSKLLLRSTRVLPLLLGLEVVEKDRSLLRLLAPILDDNARAVDNLARVSLAVQHTQTRPLAQLLSIRNLQKRNRVLRAECNDQLLVGFFFTSIVEHAQVSLSSVKSLRSLTQASCESIVHESKFQNTFQSIENRHLALRSCIACHLNFIGFRHNWGRRFFSVRL